MNLSSAYLKFLPSFSVFKKKEFILATHLNSAFILHRLNQPKYHSCIFVCNDEKNLNLRKEEISQLTTKYTISTFLPTLEEGLNNLSQNKLEEKKSYHLLQKQKPLLLFTTPQALTQAYVPLKNLNKLELKLAINQKIDFEKLKSILIDFGFSSTHTTNSIGEFSVRGFIVDIFPYFCKDPIRIEFWGQQIESIRSFDAFSQRSLKSLKQIEIHSLKDLSSLEKPTQHLSDLFSKPPYLIIENEQSWSNTIQKNSLHWSNQEVEEKIKHLPQTIGIPFEAKSVLQFNLEPEPQWESLKEAQSFIKTFSQKRYKILLVFQDQEEQQLFLKKETQLIVDQFVIGYLPNGFIHHQDKVAFLTYHNLFSTPLIKKSSSFLKGKTINLSEIQSFQKKDWIIHENYGLGQFLGVKKINIHNHFIDCIILQYANQGTLTLPIHDFKKISKYLSVESATPKLANLNSKAWERKKNKIKKSIVKLAENLIQLYAKREHLKGFAFKKDSLNQIEFEKSFPYPLTKDQNQAIMDTKKDMEKHYPMERLICGDVGFGKTEVALRATFKCVDNNKQVVLLAPTTLLSQQLFLIFEKRMSAWPFVVKPLNRFVSPKIQKETKELVSQGKVDVLIGTHKVLSKDISFKNLGLIIIDEEQKFGVKQKEDLKEKYLTIDSISLSATPIPRSLHLSLLNIRPFSTILTPPKNRLSIHTDDIYFEKKKIIQILKREHSRGGQSFFIYNRTADLDHYTQTLKEWLPDFKIATAHGKISEKLLESTMVDFSQAKYDILVCTSVIETGIDLPNVNTMIIHHPEHFGISELFQLRGRVGRSATQAYCYLTLNPDNLSDRSQKRIELLKSFTDLGSGYALAVQDLEIRGVGNIFGTEQKGHLFELGYQTYCKFIHYAIADLQGTPIAQWTTKINFPDDAFLEEKYIPSHQQRISLYQKISQIDSLKNFEEIEKELKDRFGKLPKATQNLIEIGKLSWLSQFFKFTQIEFQGKTVIFKTRENLHTNLLKKFFSSLTFPLHIQNIEDLFQIVCIFPSTQVFQNLKDLNHLLEHNLE